MNTTTNKANMTRKSLLNALVAMGRKYQRKGLSISQARATADAAYTLGGDVVALGAVAEGYYAEKLGTDVASY